MPILFPINLYNLAINQSPYDCLNIYTWILCVYPHSLWSKQIIRGKCKIFPLMCLPRLQKEFVVVHDEGKNSPRYFRVLLLPINYLPCS